MQHALSPFRPERAIGGIHASEKKAGKLLKLVRKIITELL
jgi:hypothetical protein